MSPAASVEKADLPKYCALLDSTGGNSDSSDVDWWDHTYARTECPPEVSVKEETELTKDSVCTSEAIKRVKINTELSDARVKQEPLEMCGCEVSEAGMLTGLYTEHVVKDELVMGLECVQHPPTDGDSDGSRVSEAAMLAGLYTEEVKDEIVLGPKLVHHPPAGGDSAGSRGSEAAMLAGLYTDHVVKDELVLGPECVEQPPVPGRLCSSNMPVTLKQEPFDTGPSREFVQAAVTNNTQIDHEVASSEEEADLEHEVDMTMNTFVQETVYANNTHINQEVTCSVDEEADLKHEVDMTMNTVVEDPVFTKNTQIDHEVTSSEEGVDLEHDIATPLSTVVQDTVFTNNTQIDQEVTCSVDEEADLKHEVDTTMNTVVEDTVFTNNTQIDQEVTRSVDEEADLEHKVYTTTSTVVEPAAVLTNNTQVNTDHEVVTRSDEEADLKRKVDRSMTFEDTYVCDVCNEEFALKPQLITHIAVHINNQDETKYSFANDVKIVQASPALKRNGELTLRECFVSIERIPLETALIPATVHSRAASHGTTGSRLTRTDTRHPTIVCGICNKIFKRKYKLIEHIQLHTEENPEEKNYSHNKSGKSCNACGSFESHHKCKPYVCDICGKQYKKSFHFARHNRIHMEKLYSCNICKKEFTRLNNLRDHKWIHTGRKLYSCDICSKQFTQLRSLKVHKRIHTGETPYSCEICKKGFTRLNNIKRHRRTHTGEIPYSCEICNKEFTRMSNLQEHIQIHLGDKSYSCEICKRQFTRLRTLKLHEKKFHRPEKS